MKNNRIVISIAILLVVVCLCLTTAAVVSGGIYFLGGDRLTGFFATATPTARPVTATPLPSDTDSIPTPFSGTPTPKEETTSELPEEVASQMDEIQQQVERIRSLDRATNVTRSLLTVEQLRAKVEDEFLADYTPEEVADDVRVLTAFGLLEPGYDLYNLYLELYTEQIAGYYDIEKDEMYVVLEEGFGGPQRSTYAHEYTHALQNQTHNVRENLNYTEEYCETDSEYCAAIQALIEGDAVLTEQSWYYLYATDRDRKEIDDYYQTIELSVFDSAPVFMQEDMMFPYSKGVDFVLTLFEEGGFASIDQAYIDPPVSTEQILHPDGYPDDRPVRVELPDLSTTLGRDLRELDRGVMGEWYTYLILSRGSKESFRLDDDQSIEAAAGWGGDAYAVYWDEQANQPVVVLYTVWDSTSDADDYSTAFEDYGSLRWGKPVSMGVAGELSWDAGTEGAVIFSHTGNVTIWVIAPDSSDARMLMDTLSLESIVGER